MRSQSESRQREGLAGTGPSEPNFSLSQGAPPWEGCQGRRTAGASAGNVVSAWLPRCRTGSAIASGSLPGSDPSVACPAPARREGHALRGDGHFCVRATLRCCPEVIEPEVIDIGPGEADGPV